MTDEQGKPPYPIPLFETADAVPRTIVDHSLECITWNVDPRLGVTFRYTSKRGAWVDAYLYDLGLAEVTSDLQSPEVEQWFKDSYDTVLQTVAQGTYQNFEFRGGGILHFPDEYKELGMLCHWANFTYTNERQDGGSNVPASVKTYSHLTLRTDCGWINKVRYSSPDGGGETEADFYNFVLWWTAAVMSAGHKSRKEE